MHMKSELLLPHVAGSTAGALSIACSLSAMIYALGDVSGSVPCVFGLAKASCCMTSCNKERSKMCDMCDVF